ncbi:terminase [Microbacterium phage Bandik]|uniref:Terminase n=33 Tax=Ilzatvirus TaxID=2560150 RepID=A0A345KZR1_9CAUD|nr:terminase large subunit [Microbacterium phage Ilzat]AUX82651.1 terminase [Microbacterium phage AxiPup]AUX83089.1 terminase [Microbacterium phage Peep]AUX83278.1 terminase [Microbacterium phage Superfresh]AVJ50475.1 terminase [Microbacterium phage Nattles]AVJ51199.1 terminase [Microbacterium phage PuppyEggo]AVJ51447.1 terminase [Microbacterium phage StingRay]AVO25180.1 terminase [Microbacterium phage Gelo]AVR56024.1 terminase [Microbacterium phage Bandik]AVR56204.1 terminase [Microbacter
MSTSLLDSEFKEYTFEEVEADFTTFCLASGIRESALTEALTLSMPDDALDTPLGCVAYSTPPQEGKTTWIVHYIAWQLVRNPWLKVVYATYSQARANAVSRQVRGLVRQWTPLAAGSSNVQRWETKEGGGLLAAGRGSAMTGFRSDFTVIDDPIKDMQEAQSELIRETTVDWFSSVVLTRMSNLSQIVVICTRWHKDDLIAHVVKSLDAEYINIPAQASHDDDVLDRKIGEWLPSVQNRSEKSWQLIKAAVGTYVWQALYQGDPQVTGGSYLNVDKIDVIPAESVIYQDQRTGSFLTLDRALVIQSWDLTFGDIDTTGKRRKTDGSYVAGHVYAVIGGTKWILVDRIHERLTFTESVSAVLRMSAKWPQTSRIYVEKKANGAAMLNTLRKRAALIKPVEPGGSKEVRALAAQPTVDQGNVAWLDTVYDERMAQEFRDFPFGKHDDDVDAFTQAVNNGKQDYFRMGN